MITPITIIIPNFNGEELLRRNLPSVICAANYYDTETKVIVVDDGSTDNSLMVLKIEFPAIKVVTHSQNKGFAEAIYSGIKAAETEILFLLNSDVEVSKNILEPLVSYFDDPSTFSVNPLIYDEQGKVKRHSWNLRRLKWGKLNLVNWALEDAVKKRKTGVKLPTMYAHGGSFMVKKSMFMALGGFHPIYKPYYGEDFDLGLRAWLMAWPSYFEPSVSIVHQSIGSIRATNKMNQVKAIRRRNRYVLEWVHFTPIQLIFFAIPSSVLQVLGELVMFDHVNLKGFFLALLKLKQVVQLRKEIESSRIMTFNQVLNAIND